MYIYHPNSVEIPEDVELQRVIPYPPEVAIVDRSKEDVKTIFHDVFISPITKKLHCIGPTLYNLKGELFPIKTFIDGKEIRLHYYQIERLFFLESSPLTFDLSKGLSIEFRFKSFSKKMDIDFPKDEVCSADYNESDLTISTLQKDNRIEWISDWILWHKRLHGVDRVVLYDNGSSNSKELIEFLPSLEPEVKIIFVLWTFPFGIQPYRSAQHGSLNHCRLKFPVSGGFCLNLDIDEYLGKSKNETLRTFLRQTLRYPSPGAVIFKCKIVPNTVSLKQNKLPRCFDYKHVLSTTSSKHKHVEIGRWYKYAYSFENIGYNAPHKTRSHLNRLFCKRFNFFHKIQFHYEKTVWRIKRLLFQTSTEKPKIDSVTAEESDLYYFHIHGLTSGWRGQHSLKSYSKEHESNLEFEPTIRNLARLANLVPSKENRE